MFKIQDNPDGSTSIYCKNSGNLLCTIPGKKNSSVPRRVNVVEPQPVNAAGSSRHTYETSLHIKEFIQPKEEPVDNVRTRESKCCISPIPINLDSDQTEDYFDDCITQDEFAKCLNLISHERLQTDNRQVLLAEYPLRLLSRSKAYRTLEDCPTEDLRDLKLPDYMPLTSHLGMKILRLNEGRNFIGSQKVQIAVKKYDSYCRFPFNAPKPSECHFPKLRCREKKQYPICTTAKTMRHDANHYYTYGRRQRYERMITMNTGLDARSRRLLSLCCTKEWQVKLKKLTTSEIASWKKKRCQSSTLMFPKDQTFTALRTSFTYNKYKCNKKCIVLLKNVKRYIHKHSGEYYVRGTSIRIPFYADFLRQVEARRQLVDTDASYSSSLSPGFSNDHAYYRSFSNDQLLSSSFVRKTVPKSPLKPRNAEFNGGILRSSLERNVGDALVDGKSIPVIDLTGETTPPKESSRMAPKKGVASNWQFRCFACGFERVYWNNGTPAREADVDVSIRDHLQLFHAVMDPDLFLSRYMDRVNRCIIVEAFPGYKGNFHA